MFAPRHVGLFCGSTLAVAMMMQPYRPMVFMGSSMEPTYRNGSIVLTEPPPRQIQRGEVVVLRTPYGTLVKRVALVAGDRVGQFESDGEFIDMINIAPRGTLPNDRRFRWFTVPKGQIYVLGDNRTNSVDSRVYGCFPISDIERVLVDQRPYRSSPIWAPPSRLASNSR